MTLDSNPAYLLTTDGHHELWLVNMGTYDEPVCEWYVFLADVEVEIMRTDNAFFALSLHEYISTPFEERASRSRRPIILAAA